ncbi:MAG: heme exporter protein CcmD [Burkholderiales bacterium 28-67-8]|nr:MAG: heme exporter protein CcmD [Burkholderiales bacterium 28-67-8]
MIWKSWSDFLAMGGYGLYVWGSFGVTAAAIAAEMWSVAARRKALLTTLTHAGTDESGDTE